MTENNTPPRSRSRTHLMPREIGQRVGIDIPNKTEAFKFAHVAYNFAYRRKWVMRCRWDRDAGKLYVTRAA